MGRATKLILIALLTFTLFAGAQTASAPPPRESGGTVNSAPQSTLIHILTPVTSRELANNITTVRFELTKPGVIAGTPNYLVQMDGADPVTTSQTQQVFTGLTAGAHTATVELLDANGTPIQDGRAAVQFFVATPPAQPATRTPGGTANTPPSKRELKIAGFKFQRPDPASANQDESNLPPASSPLPIISIIGFGVLVGGIVSAMKTRS